MFAGSSWTSLTILAFFDVDRQLLLDRDPGTIVLLPDDRDRTRQAAYSYRSRCLQSNPHKK
ncbi:hypothetical protein [Chamaesiphon sp. OTE_20_metabat_361]|uniref:hypothetical protein n=1 Tax=Chamaesiphon sp. OTE_20_metabat_361 TaxID=2964689 RepID=UPI00286AB627|nr:hypothetical protein [Chamaesiphon sp. OTE_20_metabat_361]